jgi:hypothetical protein
MARIVEDLVFRPRMPRELLGGGDAVDDAAVAVRCDLPVEAQFEVAILLGGHQIAALAVEHQLAVDGAPSSRRRLRLVAAPPGQRRAVKEQFPALRLFLRGQRRHLGIHGRSHGKQSGEHE